MQTEIEIQGTVLPDGTLKLDEGLGLPPGRVVIRARSVEPSADKLSPEERQRIMMELIDSFVASSKLPGVVPRTAEEIDREIAEGRAADEARMRRNELASQGQ